MDYELLDCGEGEKLERFGPYILARPAPQAVWKKQLPPSAWKKCSAYFTRDQGNKWHLYEKIPKSWNITFHGITLELSLTGFGHVGVFPEHAALWQWMSKQIADVKKPEVLNLFAYTGAGSLALAQKGAAVCHVDASKKSVSLARRNAEISHLEKAPIRWIVEDVRKFLKREIKRKHHYEGILLDPPSFGRGSKHEVFKIEEDLLPLLELCFELLEKKGRFLLLSCHTPGYTPLVLKQLLSQITDGTIEGGEMTIRGKCPLVLPCGSYARWRK